MTRPVRPSIDTLRLAVWEIVTDDEADLGRVTHEATPVDLIAYAERLRADAPIGYVDLRHDLVYVLSRWSEDAVARCMCEEVEVPVELADALVDGRLDDLIPARFKATP